MAIAFGVLMCLAGLFAALWIYSLLANFWTAKLQSYEDWSDRFFNLSARLLDEKDLPQDWVEAISTLNSWIDDHTTYVGLARLYRNKNLRKDDNGPGEPLAEGVGSFIDTRPDLARVYISAMRAAFLALTFLAPFKLGEEIRSDMAQDWQRISSKGLDVAPAVEEIEAVRKASHLKLVYSAA